MNRKIAFFILVICAGVLTFFYGCKRQQPEVSTQPENTFTVKGSVREMNIYPDPTPEFPEHDGKAEFVSYCGICHSLKYITMQPNFPPKTWDAEVTKMVVKYHAPIDSVNSKKIVAYLVAVKSNS